MSTWWTDRDVASHLEVSRRTVLRLVAESNTVRGGRVTRAPDWLPLVTTWGGICG